YAGIRPSLALHDALPICLLGAGRTPHHQQAGSPVLDEMPLQASDVGAVNTIVRRGTRLIGDNTDVAGFLEPLNPLADELHGGRMLVIGAGGAARAVVYALLTTFQPERLTLAARTPTRAERLADDLAPFDKHGALEVRPSGQLHEAARRARLIVNATPLGTHPKIEDTPLPDMDALGPEHIVYDLVYNPETTRLLRDAASRGARTIGGLEMLIAQAAAAFVQWTGTEMPLEAVRKALRNRPLQSYG